MEKPEDDNVVGPAAHADAGTLGEEEEDADGGQEDLPEDLALLPPDEPLSPTPTQVAELAAACVRFVTTRYGVMLDFEPETLSLLDQYVRDVRGAAEVTSDGVSTAGVSTAGTSIQSVLAGTTAAEADVPGGPLIQAAVGAYLGEVMRRAYGGSWFADGDHDGWRVDMTRVFLTFNPIGMVREALLLASADGWHAHLEMDEAEKADVLRRLDALPEVSDDEFYAPTTRFDVVGIAVEALRAQMVAAGLGDVRFGPDDYRRS